MEQQAWIPPSLGFPGPCDRGKGSDAILRETTSQDAVRWRGPREKDIPLCEWHSIQDTSLSWNKELPLCGGGVGWGVDYFYPEPTRPVHCEWVSWIKGGQELGNAVIECRGDSLVTPQEWCPKLEALFQQGPFQLLPRIAFPLAGGRGHLVLVLNMA